MTCVAVLQSPVRPESEPAKRMRESTSLHGGEERRQLDASAVGKRSVVPRFLVSTRAIQVHVNQATTVPLDIRD